MKPYIEISESTLYTILKRLELSEMLTVKTSEHNGRLRKYYHITKAGLARIEDFKNEWREVIYMGRLCFAGGLCSLRRSSGNSLVIEVLNSKKWYEYIGINFGTSKITVNIPEGEYGKLSVRSDTGDVEIPKEIAFSSIDISVSTGDIDCYASALEDVKVKATTGDIHLEGISTGSLDLSVSTGKVTAADIVCKSDVTVGVSTGKAHLTDITCQNLTSSGGTGNIKISIQP